MSENTLIVVLSTADFHAKLWTNKQRLTLQLAEEYEIVYVNSLGLRRVRLTFSDISRIASRILSKRSKHVPSKGIRVVNPLVLPYQGKIYSRLNASLLNWQMKRILKGVSRKYSGHSAR